LPVICIDTHHDPRLSAYRNVPDAELLTRHGLFVAEGRLVVRRLLADSSLSTQSVMVTEAAMESLADVLFTRDGIPVYVVPQSVMDEIAGFNIHRGCLALGERPPRRSLVDLTTNTRRLVAMERVGNADNVGAIVRNAAAFGADGILIGPSCTDPLYRKAIRTSMAAALTMPFADAQPWPGVLRDLHTEGWTVIAMTPSPAALPLADVADIVRGQPTVVVVGHEGEGLSSDSLAASSYQARIPMAAEVDSVNVATAVAIALYELTRSP
jgi:tRNA G18 (ribose-2'-O)-methylase SpoU